MEKNAKGAKTQSKKSKKASKSSPVNSNQRLVEYSDVSSIELSGPESAPEAGELPSDGLSIVSDDEISTIGTTTNNNNNSIYEPIDDDDDELEKLMVGDGFSDTFSDFNKRSKDGKRSKKQKKAKKSKKRKKSDRGRRPKKKKSSEESIEEISDDEALLSSDNGDKNSRRIEEGNTPPLDSISYTPKKKYDAYTPISPGNLHGNNT